MLLGLLPALSYSDLVKSWRGECGGGGIRCYHTCGPQYMYTCILARRPHKVIAWAIGLLYKVYVCMYVLCMYVCMYVCVTFVV